MLGFQWLMYLLISVATIVVLRRLTVSIFLECLVPLAVVAAFLPEGLRPEAFSVAMTMTGLALLQKRNTGRLWLLFGFFLMILGASAAERITFFSGALILSVIFDLQNRGVPVRRLLFTSGIALAIVLICMMGWIGFRFSEFWRVFHFCAVEKTNAGMWTAVKNLFYDITIFRWPVVLLGLVMMLFLPWLREKGPTPMILLLLGAMVTMILIGGIGHGTVWYVTFILLLIGAAGVKLIPENGKILLPLVIAAVLLIANGRLFIFAIGMLGDEIKSDKGDQWAETRTLQSTPEHPLLLDCETARYVFNYRLPRNSLDWFFSAPFPKVLPTDVALRPNDIYLIGPDTVNYLNLKTHLNLDLPKWEPLGTKKTFYRYPEKAYLIHPADCGGLKP